MIDVAAAAGVSRSTVSLVMQGSPLVTPSTRKHVLRHAEQLGYVYNRGAASLRTQRRGIVGLVIPDSANPFIAQASIGFQTALAEQRHIVVVGQTLDELDRQREVLQALSEHQLDGLLLIPAIGTSAADIEHLVRAGTPVVLLNRPLDSALPYVGPDERAIGILAVDHLAKVHGVASVAYFGGVAEAKPRIVRDEVARQRAATLGVAVTDEWCVPCAPTADAGYKAASALIAHRAPPDGLVCHTDEIALGVLRAMYEHGIGPDRCRVVGVDNAPDAAYWNPSLTSIAVHPEQIGFVGGQVLLGEMDRIDPDEITTRPPVPRLVVRESCGCNQVA
jgi:LacI family transcriptional regulator, galactose operon repressor